MNENPTVVKPRPSGLNRLLHYCTGSLKAESGLTEFRTTSDLADVESGRSIHEVVLKFIGEDKDAETSYLQLSVEDRQAVLDIRACFDEACRLHGKPIRVFREHNIGPFIPLNVAHGTGHVDLIVHFEKICLIVDIKRFSIQWHPSEHFQLIAYALGATCKWRKFELFELAIWQPGHEHEGWQIKRRGLELMGLEINKRLDDIIQNADQQPRTPTPEGCRYCLARGTVRCPESTAQIEALQKIEPEKLTRPMKIWLLQNWSGLENIRAQIRNEIMQAKLNDPEAYPEFYIRRGSTTTFVKDPQVAAKILNEDLGIPFEDILFVSKLSFQGLIDLIVHRNGCSVEQAKGQLLSVLADYDCLGNGTTADALMSKKTTRKGNSHD